METFSNKEDYLAQVKEVDGFHSRVKNTILNYLKEHGNYIIPEKERHYYTFCYLDNEGCYETNALVLSEDGDDFYLESTRENGKKCYFGWCDINYDMIIEETLMSIVFPELNDE